MTTMKVASVYCHIWRWNIQFNSHYIKIYDHSMALLNQVFKWDFISSFINIITALKLWEWIHAVGLVCAVFLTGVKLLAFVSCLAMRRRTATPSKLSHVCMSLVCLSMSPEELSFPLIKYVTAINKKLICFIWRPTEKSDSISWGPNIGDSRMCWRGWGFFFSWVTVMPYLGREKLIGMLSVWLEICISSLVSTAVK